MRETVQQFLQRGGRITKCPSSADRDTTWRRGYKRDAVLHRLGGSFGDMMPFARKPGKQ